VIAFGSLPWKARTSLSSRPCRDQCPCCLPASRLFLLFTLSITFSLNTEAVKSCNLRTRGGVEVDGLTEHEKQPLALPLRLLCCWAGLHMCHPSPPLPSFPRHRPSPRGAGKVGDGGELLLGPEPGTRTLPGLPGQMRRLPATPRSLPVPCGIWRVIFNFLGTAVRVATGRSPPGRSLRANCPYGLNKAFPDPTAPRFLLINGELFV